MLELLLRTPSSGALEARIFAAASLHAPHLLDLEVAQVLRRYERAGEMTPLRAREALEDFAAFPIERYPHTLFLPRIWSLRANATAYHACYLALAEALGASLVTRDRRLASVPGHEARVEVIP
jgi:predicted nucleic acid-binding protein